MSTTITSCWFQLCQSLQSQASPIVMARNSSLFLAVFFVLVASAVGQNNSTGNKTFTLVNKCKETIWPAIITRGDDSHGDGFALKQDQTASYRASTGWSGRIWARTGCKFDSNGNGSCITGSCGTSLNCTAPSSPPNTIAEFTLGSLDFYDVSLVDGFNVPIAIQPLKGTGNCSFAGCDGDLRQHCPTQLAVNSDGKTIACRSACNVYGTDEYCCRGAFSDPVTCLPTNYSKSFKEVCPASSSYAFDDRTSIITCSASNYVIAFCASKNQTLCSYQDNKVVCNTSSTTSKALHCGPGWWSLVLASPLMFLLQLIF